MKVLDRIRNLIERAAHPTANEHEARNAAVEACRLIKKHEVRLEIGPIPQSAPAPAPQGPFRPYGVPRGENRTTTLDELLRRPGAREVRGELRTANAPANGTCVHCLEPFYVGDRIWTDGVEGVHAYTCEPTAIGKVRRQ